MTTKPNNWLDEDREVIVTEIIEGILAEMTEEDFRNLAFDKYYDELIVNEWADLWMFAEDYAPHLLDKFNNSSNTDTSQ